MTYKYMGTGWAYGVPARDLTDEEFAALTPELQAVALTTHKLMQPRKPSGSARSTTTTTPAAETPPAVTPEE